MAYVKYALVVAFLAIFVMFPMKKVEGCAQTWCERGSFYPECGLHCACVAGGFFGGDCVEFGLVKNAVREHYNLCECDDDCIKKGSGSICAYFPNSQPQHGWCFTSNVEAERYFEVLSNPAIVKFFKNIIKHANEKECLKMPLDNITKDASR